MATDRTTVINELKFEETIKAMGDRQLLEFVARKALEASVIVQQLENDIYGTKDSPGLSYRVKILEKAVIGNRNLTLAMWAINVTLAGAVLTLLIRHMGG